MTGMTIYILIWAVHAILGIVALVDLFRQRRFDGAFLFILVLVILFFPIIGPLIYFLLRDAKPKSRWGGE